MPPADSLSPCFSLTRSRSKRSAVSRCVMALVGEPMLVFANPRHGHRLGDYFLCALKLTAVLSLPAAVVLLILTILLPVPSLAGVAVALPAVCLYTVTRLVCFTCGKPWRALRGDVAFVAAALLGLLAVSSVGGLNVGTAFLVLAGANVAALLIATGADTVFWRSSDVSLRTLFAENWKFGRWLIGYQILKWGMGLGVIPRGLGSRGRSARGPNFVPAVRAALGFAPFAVDPERKPATG
jgi:hypothetical protein